MYKAIKTLEEMPGALSYLIEKVEGLEKTAQSLLNRQEECCSPHWMDGLRKRGKTATATCSRWLSSEGLTSCHPSTVPT